MDGEGLGFPGTLGVCRALAGSREGLPHHKAPQPLEGPWKGTEGWGSWALLQLQAARWEFEWSYSLPISLWNSPQEKLFATELLANNIWPVSRCAVARGRVRVGVSSRR